jgi:hypothetical protein
MPIPFKYASTIESSSHGAELEKMFATLHPGPKCMTIFVGMQSNELTLLCHGIESTLLG